jgi:hypothetical protein
VIEEDTEIQLTGQVDTTNINLPMKVTLPNSKKQKNKIIIIITTTNQGDGMRKYH